MSTPEPEEVARAICVERGLILCGEVGRGSFKRTFEVRNSDGGSFALKIFLGTVVDERTEREVETMLRLSHPNVGKLIEYSSISIFGAPRYYLLEEFLAGGTLAGRIKESALDRLQLKDLACPLVAGLAHIASFDLVHRDIKPDNILFRIDPPSPVIVDFGLVRDLSSVSLTPTWAAVGPGTPLFSSPEQLNNEKNLIDWRSDQFSMGLVLTLCRYREHPYVMKGEDGGAAIERIAMRTPLSAEFKSRILNDGLEILLRMIEPWPVRRFRTTADLAKAWSQL